MRKLLDTSLAAFLVSLLTGCGAGGDPAPEGIASLTLANTTSAETSEMIAVTMTAANRTTDMQTGTLSRADDYITLIGLTGEIDDGRTTIALDGGGQALLEYGDNAYSARFVAEPTAGNRLIGVVGISSATNEVPAGTVEYTGSATVTIHASTDIYELTGDATLTAEFSVGEVTTTLDGLNGIRTSGTNSSDVSDVAQLAVSGSEIDGVTFSGGIASVASSAFSISENPDVSVSGGFFGPDAAEAGTVIILDDSVNGDTRIFADILVSQK